MANITTSNTSTFAKQLLAAQNVAKAYCDSGIGRFGDVLTDDAHYYVFGRDLFKQLPNGRFSKTEGDESMLAHCLSFEMAGTGIVDSAARDQGLDRAAHTPGRGLLDAEQPSSKSQIALERACVADDEVKGLTGFSLMAKVNGRVVRYSMRLASKLRQEQELATKGVDGLNDLMTSLAAEAAEMESRDNFAMERSEDPEEALVLWLSIRNLLGQSGYKAQPLSDTFTSMLTNEQQKQTADPTTLANMAKVSGLGEETVRSLLAQSGTRNLQRTAETIRLAMQQVSRVMPQAQISPDADHTCLEAPFDFAELYQGAIDSAKKSALRIARDPISALAQLATLRAEEDWT